MTQIVKDDMNIVITGHVDHGKSTIIGRLLADTDSLPEGKLNQVRETCRRNARPFEYAFLLDALKEEQAQGITIDTARCFFRSERRNYLIMDAPGHIEFLKNMVTGAARAEAALLVIDAQEGIQQNSRRHAFMLSMLGIRQLAVLVNKMDLVDYSEAVYNDICQQFAEFLSEISMPARTFIPVSGTCGDNIARPSAAMDWYQGGTVLDVLDNFAISPPLNNKPFRMPVQAVYKFTEGGDQRRIIAGTIESGSVSAGDEVVFYPSGKRTFIKTIEGFNTPPLREVQADQATGFTLTDPLYISRGEMMARADQPQPLAASRLRVTIFWLGPNPLTMDKEYVVKCGSTRVKARLQEIVRIIDASTLDDCTKACIERHDVAECILQLERDIAFDLPDDILSTGRFVLVDDYEIAGGGLIHAALADKKSPSRDKVRLRNYKWDSSFISPEERWERSRHHSGLVLISGAGGELRKNLAKSLEKELFDRGALVYFMSLGNFLYGLDADIKLAESNHSDEHFRRLAEVGHLMLDAGMILIVTARGLSSDDVNQLAAALEDQPVVCIGLGQNLDRDIPWSLVIEEDGTAEEGLVLLLQTMREHGLIPTDRRN